MSPPSFSTLLQRFFTEHLTAQRNLSVHTVSSYRDTFRLLLRFLSGHLRATIDKLTLDDITPDNILVFLDQLERSRQNGPRTRNYRLAAIRAFARYVISLADPGMFPAGERLLAIPSKRAKRPLLGFLSRAEIDALFGACDQSTWSGRRDRLLFLLIYNTGARISEALQLRAEHVQDRVARLHGKGRKERFVPLWSQTAAGIRRWCRDNQIQPHHLIFTNRSGVPLSRHGARFRLQAALLRARVHCPSLEGRKIGLHTLRHSCAMHLLQSGVSLEVIALWLGHESPATTHGYLEADLKMKEESLRRLEEPRSSRKPRQDFSRIIAFLEAL